MTHLVTVVGASGFVGSAVCDRLSAKGVEVRSLAAPRITGSVGAPLPPTAEIAELAATLRGSTAVVNAAGVSDALASSEGTLDGANGLLPGLLARACLQAQARLIQVSSAAVQGAKPSLDSSTDFRPFSAYSRAKIIGEQAVMAVGGDVCIYRPPGVHAPNRQVTRSVIRLARSPLSSVAAPGTDNAPQALLENVADAIAFLAIHPHPLPTVVHHPPEGITTAALLSALGGRSPRLLPRPLAQGILAVARSLSRVSPPAAGVSRRLEVLWFGQGQDPSWLSGAGWSPPVGAEGWRTLATNDKVGVHD